MPFCVSSLPTATATTQLTITLPDELAQQAEAYARATGRSLTEIVEEILTDIAQRPAASPYALSPQVRALLGAATLPEGMSVEQIRDEYLAAKYL